MRVILIAAMDPNGVIGRTSKACRCDGGISRACRCCNIASTCGDCHGSNRSPYNTLPWGSAYPEHREHIEAATHGHAVIYGYRTKSEWGALAMPMRDRAVLTVGHDASLWGYDMLDGAVEAAGEDGCDVCFVLGGARLFAEALPIADELRLTLIGREYEGDVKFPHCYPRVWWRPDGIAITSSGTFNRVSSKPCPTNADLTFTTWVRR